MRELPTARKSVAWSVVFPVEYRLIRLLDPVIRRIWLVAGLGNVVELRVVGRRSGRRRSVLLGLLRGDGRWFLGHPNGDVAWTRNLEAAGVADVVFHDGAVQHVRALRLAPGAARDAAIAATWQHVFPGNLLYRLAWAHIRAVGTYFLIEPAVSA